MAGAAPLGALLIVVCIVFAVARFVDLGADPPADLTWSASLYTDEGYWARNALWATRADHWHIEDDYNPASVMPVVPLLQRTVFGGFGVSIVAARAISATAAAALILLTFLWLRRGESLHVALLGTLLVATNALLFFNSRLAFLDLPTAAFAVASLLLATGRGAPIGGARAAASGVLLGTAILTKLTAVVFAPALGLVALLNPGPLRRRLADASLLGIAAVAVVGAWFAYGLHSYPSDFALFRSLNLGPGDHLAAGGLGASAWSVAEIASLFVGHARSIWGAAKGGLEIGVVVYPVALAVCAIAVLRPGATLRRPVVLASLLVIGGGLLSFSAKDYAPPRYFVGLVVPASALCVVALDTLYRRPRLRAAALVLALAVGADVVAQTTRVIGVLGAPEHRYSAFVDALEARFRRDGETRPILLGDGADTIALHTDALAITLDVGGPNLADRIARYRPTYLFYYKDVPRKTHDEIERFFEVGAPERFSVFPDYLDGRRLTIHRLTPREEGLREARAASD